MTSSIEGRNLLQLRESKSPLSESNSRILIEKIVDFFIQKEINLSVDLADDDADQIIINFPQEAKVNIQFLYCFSVYIFYYYYSLQQTYFLRRKGKAPKGRLYDKYCNRKKLLKNANIVQPRKRKVTENEPKKTYLPETNGETIQQQLLFFKDYTHGRM